DLVLKVADPFELPPGTPSFRYWDEDEIANSDGATPLAVRQGQRVYVVVAAEAPEHALPPGTFTGALALSGSAFSRIVALRRIYLAVDENSAIGRKWLQMGGEQRLGEVRSNAHPAPDGKGVIQEFANGVLYEAPGIGVFFMSPAIYAKWTSPEVTSAKDTVSRTVQD